MGGLLETDRSKRVISFAIHEVKEGEQFFLNFSLFFFFLFLFFFYHHSNASILLNMVYESGTIFPYEIFI